MILWRLIFLVEGKYNLSLNTPIGEITGTLELKKINGSLCGTLETMGTKNNFTGGTVEGNKCAFSGEFKTPIGPITYEILGIVEGDNLDIYAETNKGRFKISGKRA